VTPSTENLFTAILDIADSRRDGILFVLEPQSSSLHRLRRDGASDAQIEAILLQAQHRAVNSLPVLAHARTLWSRFAFAMADTSESLVEPVKAFVANLLGHHDCKNIDWLAVLTRVFPGDARRTLQCDPGYDLRLIMSSALVWVEPYGGGGDDWELGQRYPSTRILWHKH